MGEATLGVLAALLVFSRLRPSRAPIRLDTVALGLLIYLGIGALYAISGLAARFDLAVLRDFALVYYLALFFFAAEFIRRNGQPIALLRALAWRAAIG